jgi:2-methylisocitrate lyase-like PEP mutase family enzyme
VSQLDVPVLAARADLLRDLHRRAAPLILANAWDVSSARAVVSAGFPVVATTSAGLDDSLGFDDHNVADAQEVLAAIRRIARAVDVPVTADLEGGFGLGAPELIHRMLSAGAVGCNIEDTDYDSADGPAMVPIDVQAARIAAIKSAGRAAGVDIVLNARIDLWINRLGADDAARLAETIARAQAYRAAGADCIYPIAAHGPDLIAALVDGGPLNIMALPDGPSIASLTGRGVQRISTASMLHRAAQRDLAARLAHLQAERLPEALG